MGRGGGGGRELKEEHKLSESLPPSLLHHDIRAEVVYAVRMVGLLQVVVEPSQQNLFWRESHEVFEGLSLLQEDSQVGAVLQGDLRKETNLEGGKRDRESV